MMTPSNWTIFASLTLCEGNSPVTDGFPSQRPVTRSFDDFFDLRRINRSRRWWFETPQRTLWHHCNVTSLCENGCSLCVFYPHAVCKLCMKSYTLSPTLLCVLILFTALFVPNGRLYLFHYKDAIWASLRLEFHPHPHPSPCRQPPPQTNPKSPPTLNPPLKACLFVEKKCSGWH